MRLEVRSLYGSFLILIKFSPISLLVAMDIAL